MGLQTTLQATDVALEEPRSEVAEVVNPSPRPTELDISTWEDDGGAILPQMRTLFVLVPLHYNNDIRGNRVPIEPEKLEETKTEIRAMFPAGTWYPVSGWCREEATGKCVDDDAVRYEIDGVYEARQLELLKDWKRKLERRFEQWSIYLKLGAPQIRL